MVKKMMMQETGSKIENQKNINDLFIRAARDGKFWLVESLIKISDINAKDGYGKSALDYATANQHDNISEIIKQHID